VDICRAAEVTTAQMKELGEGNTVHAIKEEKKKEK
jgi:hypothetical protein